MAAILGALSTRIYNSVRTVPVSTLWSRVTATTSILPTTWGNLSPLGVQHQPKRFGHCFEQFVNLPPVHRLAGKGNTYATTIERKRVIKDPNEPNFEHIEPLKWTTWRMLRDVRRRHMFTRYWFHRSALYNARKCRMLPGTVRVSTPSGVSRKHRD